MEKSKTSKAKEEKFKIEEIIAVTSGMGMRDVNSPEVRKKMQDALKNSTEYKYDDNKSLTENIYAAFPEYKLKELTEEYSTKMNSWHSLDMAFINKAMHVKFAASRLFIPDELTIKVKADKKEQVSEKRPLYPKAKNKYNADARTGTFGRFYE
ncbi:MAG: hypothetical protein J6N45_08445 [Alphaproteobacteria bacterium]|nr:hypothetical protein [Alphaproteobacteria bacterium]